MLADSFGFWTWQSGISMFKGRGLLKVVTAKKCSNGTSKSLICLLNDENFSDGLTGLDIKF